MEVGCNAKVKIFLWQTLLNVLLVRGVLLQIGMMIAPSCPLCGEYIEIIDHLFWDYSITKTVSSLAFQPQWVPRQQLQGQCYFSQLLTQFCLNPNHKALRRATFLLWSIWKGMNELVFKIDSSIP